MRRIMKIDVLRWMQFLAFKKFKKLMKLSRLDFKNLPRIVEEDTTRKSLNRN